MDAANAKAPQNFKDLHVWQRGMAPAQLIYEIQAIAPMSPDQPPIPGQHPSPTERSSSSRSDPIGLNTVASGDVQIYTRPLQSTPATTG